MKKTYEMFRLSFPSGLHLSRGKQDYTQGQDMLHSDTLKSALCWAAIRLSGEDFSPVEFMESFRISSAFPFVGEHDFFPVPLLKAWAATADPGLQKKLRKVKYVHHSLFTRVIHGKDISQEKFQFTADGLLMIPADADGKFPEMNQTLFKRSVQQKVTLHPLPGEVWPESGYTSTPWHIEVFRPCKEAGLFFMVEYNKEGGEETSALVNAAMTLLQDEGIGLDKNSGLGQFCFKREEYAMEIPDEGNAQMALSLYCPGELELPGINLEKSAWGLTRREGWMASVKEVQAMKLRKRCLYMFTEGSVFFARNLLGICRDIQPVNTEGQTPFQWKAHPVYRDGRALFIPFSLTIN